MVQIRVGYKQWGVPRDRREGGREIDSPAKRNYSFCADMPFLSSLPLNSYLPLEAHSNSHGSSSPEYSHKWVLSCICNGEAKEGAHVWGWGQAGRGWGLTSEEGAESTGQSRRRELVLALLLGADDFPGRWGQGGQGPR